MAVLPTDPVAKTLADASRGDAAAADALAPMVYGQLHALARSYLRGRRRDAVLQTTALVHEAYVRLLGRSEVAWEGRAHFFAVAARAMRQILSNHARDLRAQKRGGGWQRVSLSGLAGHGGERPVDLLALDEALTGLAESDERQNAIVDLHIFGGLTLEEIARSLGVSLSTVERDWRAARAWIAARLRTDEPS